jgi:hypothetical protein
MATVFNNQMVAHVWAQNNQHYGRSNNGQFYFEGPCLYSYGHHFMVGAIMPNGLAIMVHPSDSPSITTTQHISEARSAVRHRRVAFLRGLNSERYSHNHNAYALAGLAAPLAPASYKSGGRKTLLAHLRSAECADMGREDLAAILDAIGSKADPDNVLSAAKKKAEARRLRREREIQRGRLSIAREALESSPDGFAAGYLHKSDARRAATHLNRAWKAAKAAGWSKKRLDALRAREKALRARADYLEEHGERERRRASRQHYRDGTRDSIRRVRALRGSLSTAEAFDRGSDEARKMLAQHLRSALRIRPLSYPGGRVNMALDAMAAAVREAADRRRRLTQARREAAEREAFEAWLAGDPQRLSLLPYKFRTDPQGSPYLRAVDVRRDDTGQIVGGRLETSMGAEVPLTRAIKVFRFLKLARERARRMGVADTARVWHRNGERVPVGAFEVEAVYGDGAFKAGCHTVSWRQVERLAKELGVFDLDPSDEATRSVEAA